MGVSGLYLFVISEGGHLCRVNPDTGGSDDLGAGWEAVTHFTCFNNAFYLLQHGRLHKVQLDLPE